MMQWVEEDIKRVSYVFWTLGNPVMVRILLIIDETRRPMHIEAITDAVKMDYAAVYKYVKVLRRNCSVEVYVVGRSRVIFLKNMELLNQIMEIAKKMLQ